MKVGDYVIFSYLSSSGKAKPWLGKVEAIRPLKVRSEPDQKLQTKVVNLQRSDIYAVLGSKPIPGKAFGVDLTNIYRCTKQCALGDLYYFIAPDKAVRNAVLTAFKIVNKALIKYKLLNHVQSIDYCIKHLPGKTNGLYTRLKDGSVIIDIDPEKMVVDTIPQVILHEICHHLFNILPHEQQLKWVRFYVNHVQSVQYTEQQCRTVKEFVAGYEDLKTAKSELDPDYEQLFAKCMNFVRGATRLSFKQLQAFYETDRDAVLKLWPKAISLNDYQVIISEYATKNYRELFCEAMSYYMLGKDLPQTVNKLCNKTIQQLHVLEE